MRPLPHSERVAACETELPGREGGDLAGESIHHAAPSFRAGDLAADVLADIRWLTIQT